MELDYPRTPSFFSAAINGNENVFDQPFAVDDVESANDTGLHWASGDRNRSSCQQDAAASQYPSPLSATMTFPGQTIYNADYGGLDIYSDRLWRDSRMDQVEQQQQQQLSIRPHDADNEVLEMMHEDCDFDGVNFENDRSPSTSNQMLSGSQQKPEPTRLMSLQTQQDRLPDQSSEKSLEAQPKRRTRRTRKRNPPSPEAEKDKREKLLERNRVAASKCRQKRKTYTNELEGQAKELQARKTSLASLANSLKDEVLFLKGQMLNHSGCECRRIRDYLNNEADSLACSRHSRLMDDPASNVRKGSVFSTSSTSAASSGDKSPLFQDREAFSPAEDTGDSIDSVLRKSLAYDSKDGLTAVSQ